MPIVDDMDDTSLSHDNTIYRELLLYGIWMYPLLPLCDQSLVLDSPFDFDLSTSDWSHTTQ